MAKNVQKYIRSLRVIALTLSSERLSDFHSLSFFCISDTPREEASL